MALQQVIQEEDEPRGVPDWAREGLSEESNRCLDRLISHVAPPLLEYVTANAQLAPS